MQVPFGKVSSIGLDLGLPYTVADEEKIKLEKLDRDIDDAVALCAKSVKAHGNYNTKYYEAELLDIELKEKTRIYLEAQAGILAETLEEINLVLYVVLLPIRR